MILTWIIVISFTAGVIAGAAGLAALAVTRHKNK